MIIFACRTLLLLIQITFFLFLILLLLLLDYSLLLLNLGLLQLLLLCYLLGQRIDGRICLRFIRWILLLGRRSLISGLGRRFVIFIWVNIRRPLHISSLLLFHFFSNGTVKSDARHSTLGWRFWWNLVSLCISIQYFKVYCSCIDWLIFLLVPLVIVVNVARIPSNSLLIDNYLLLSPESLRLRVNEE